MMIIAMLLAAADPSPAAVDIRRACRGAPACVTRQKESLRRFLGVMAIVPDSGAAAEQCMRSAKTPGSVDWPRAERCLKAWGKGRRTTLGRPL